MNAGLLSKLRELASLGLDDVTGWAHVRVGSVAAAEILSALDDADTLRRVRELMASGASPSVAAALLAAPTEETANILAVTVHAKS